MSKVTHIKIEGRWVRVTDSTRSKFGTIVYFQARGSRATRWVYLHEVPSK